MAIPAIDRVTLGLHVVRGSAQAALAARKEDGLGEMVVQIANQGVEERAWACNRTSANSSRLWWT